MTHLTDSSRIVLVNSLEKLGSYIINLSYIHIFPIFSATHFSHSQAVAYQNHSTPLYSLLRNCILEKFFSKANYLNTVTSSIDSSAVLRALLT